MKKQFDSPHESSRTALLFPGLGGESLHRVAEFQAMSPTFREILATADAIVTSRLGESVSRIIQRHALAQKGSAWLQRPRNGTASAGPRLPTGLAHSVLFTVEFAMSQAWIAWGLEPDFVCGYSLGEYAAACVAGLFDFEVGLSLVITRAEIIQALPRGGMIAVAADAANTRALLDSSTFIVATNSADQSIVGGNETAISALAARLDAKKIIHQRVPVEYPFHTPLLRDGQGALGKAVSMVAMAEPTIPVVSTVTGGIVDPKILRSPDHWVQHLTSPVQFLEAVTALKRAGTAVYFEMGPSQALSPLVSADSDLARRSLIGAAMPSAFDGRPLSSHLLRTSDKLSEFGVPINIDTALTSEDSREIALRRNVSPNAKKDEEILGKMQELWANALRRDRVGPDDNIFDLGGSSLTTLRLVREIRNTLRANLTVRDVFAARTPRGLARTIQLGGLVHNPLPELLDLPNGLSIRYQSRAEAKYFFKSIFEEKCYMKHGIQITPGGTVIDVGANIGMFSMFAAMVQPSVKIFSIEPVPQLFDILVFNLVDVTDTAVCLNIGLSDAPGEAVITFYPENSGMSSFRANSHEERHVLECILRNNYQRNQVEQEILDTPGGLRDFLDERLRTEGITASILTLSQVMVDNDIRNIDLLKIDVQKLELNVLFGIKLKDWDRIRQIVMEVHDFDDRALSAIKLLESKGFTVTVERDPLYAGTNLVNFYAVRK